MPNMAPRAETPPPLSPESNKSFAKDDVSPSISSPSSRSYEEDFSETQASFSVSDEFFDTRAFIDFSYEIGFVTQCWNVLLGMSALLDFLAATVDSHVRNYITWETERFDPWLRKHSFELGMIFSFLWFFDSFVTAAETRSRALREAEKARLLREKGWEEKSKNAEWKAFAEFLLAVVIQLLLLPVGFYVWVTPGDTFTVTVTREDSNGEYDETETYTSTANVSLIYALFHFGMINIGNLLRERAVHHGKRSVYRYLRRSVLHPVRLAHTISKITKWIRWVRIIGPVIGTSNKLLGNTMDLIKKVKQRHDAMRAAKIRRTLWLEMTEEEAMNHAATLVQSIYRSKRSRRERRALELLQGNKLRLAALKLQKRFRSVLKRARRRLERKKRELAKLEAKAKRINRNKMSDSERIRMYKLQSELAEDAHRFINQNLLRPNTTFSVVWKITFVACVVLELSTLILRIKYPNLKKDALFPKPYSELKECKATDDGVFQKIVSSVSRRASKPQPRYCQDDMVAMQAFGIALMKVIVELILVVVNFMFFFDVPVSFFTGCFNKENGVLEPKPFFVRWIAPGVLLQMIVNPQMGTIAEVIANTVSRIRELGPFRVFRWIVAAFFPLSIVSGKWLWKLWSRFVALQNAPTEPVFTDEPKFGSVMTKTPSSGQLSVRSSVLARSDPNEWRAFLLESSK